MLRKSHLMSIAVVSAVVFMTGISISSAEDYAAKVKTSMAMLKEKTAALGQASLSGGKLKLGETEINDNYDIVDEVTEANGGTATIFMAVGEDFIRISTNVIKEGKRATGTKLDPNGPAIPLIRKGEAYYGEADILGSKYQTGYEPIKDASGKVVGVLYVGYKL